MAPASKRRKPPARARRKARSATAPLDVLRDPIRRQEVQRRRPKAPLRTPGNDLVPDFPSHEFIQLMNRRAQALVELPLRIALSRTPFEAWRHQNQFMQDIVNDCEFATLCLLKVALRPFPK